MAKTKKITFWGGFHDASAISIRVDAETYDAVKFKVENPHETDNIFEDLSKYQINRLQKHFCPFKDCLCGGIYFRTTKVEFNNE